MNTHPDPDLTPENPETSETCDMGEKYSGYLRLGTTVDSV